jgi:thioredoxin 1
MEQKILKFEADWCGPCKIMKPVAYDLSKQYKIDVVAVDIDEHPEIAQQYDVRSIPTLILLEDGVEKSRALGAQPLAKLAATLGI